MFNSGTYDWSQLDRDLIASMVSFTKPSVVDKTLSPTEFTKKIRTLLRFFKIPVSVKTTYAKETTKDTVWVGGLYYAVPDKVGQTAITLLLQFNPKNKNQISINYRHFRKMCWSLADTLLHEIVHMRQYRRRSFKDIPGFYSTANSGKKRAEQVYLGHDDEIDAYSFNIACQLIDKFGYDEKAIVNYLNSDLNDKRKKSNSFKLYLEAFDHNHKHTVIKKLKKKVMRYVPNAAEIRKPYRTTDWLKTCEKQK
jgi:hypothetical protein